MAVMETLLATFRKLISIKTVVLLLHASVHSSAGLREIVGQCLSASDLGTRLLSPRTESRVCTKPA